MSMVLSIYTLLQLAAHSDTFGGTAFTDIATIATQSSVFIKNRVNRLLGNQNKGYAYLVLLLENFM